MIILHRQRKLLLPCIILSCIPIFGSQSAWADTRIHADYIAIDVEAEDFDASAIVDHDTRWTLTDPGTPQTEQDPDGNNSDGAVGNAYVELLPDVRVTHDDPFGPPTAIWGQPGTGPIMQYPIDFPEAGRYYVHGRINSSGTEDNGIHVGLNGVWPQSGSRMQWCTGGQGWQWSSRQRASGGAGDCGVNFTIWLDVENAGMNTVMFSAREDGFEFDRFMLIKDKSDNTRVCRAAGENTVNCSDGSIETLDGFVDAAVSLDTNRTAGVEGDVFEFNAVVSNEDGFDEAEDVILTAQLNLGEDWEFVSASEHCSVSGTELMCDLGDLEPTHPGEDENLSFSLRALTGGEKEVVALVSTSTDDENDQNDASSVTVAVDQLIAYTTLSSRISIEPAAPRVLDEINVAIALENTGDATSENTTVKVDLPAELSFVIVPDGCTVADVPSCDIGNVLPGETGGINLQLTTDLEGMYPISIQHSSDNLVDGSLSDIFTIEVMSVEPTEPVDGSESLEGEDNDNSQAPVETLKTSGGALHGLSFWFLLVSLFIRRLRRVGVDTNKLSWIGTPLKI